jgi:hypothetical protein
MGRDERVPSVAVDVGVESNLTSCGRDLGDSARAHDLKRTDKTPCVTGRCMEQSAGCEWLVVSIGLLV